MARGNITIAVTGTYNDADIKSAIRDLQQLQTHATPAAGAFQKLGQSFSQMPMAMAGQFLGIGAAIGAVTMAINLAQQAISTMITSAAEDEKAMRSLEIAMQNAGQAGQLIATQETIDRLSRMSGVADDQLIPAMRTLITATGNAAQSQKLLSLAMDISAGTGKSVEQVVMALARAANGSTTALSRLGAGIDKATLASGDFDAITAILAQKFAGQAAAAADTFSGKMDRISVAVSEAGESIGYQLIGAIEQAIEAIGGTNGLTGAIQESGEAFTTVAKGIGPLTTGLIQVAKVTSPVVILLDKLGVSALEAVLMLNPLTSILYALGLASEQSEKAQTANADAILGTLDASTGAALGLDGLTDSTDNLSSSTKFAADSFEQMSWSIDNARFASDNMAAATDALNAAIASGSTSSTLAAFFGYLGDAAKKTEEPVRRASGAVRDAGNDAQRAAEQWKKAAADIITATTELSAGLANPTTMAWTSTITNVTGPLNAAMTSVTSQMVAKASELGDGMVNAFGARLTQMSSKVTAALDEAKQAIDALNSYSQGVVNNVMGSLFQVSTQDAKGNALTPDQIFNNILGGAQSWQNAAGNIAPFLTKLPQEVATQLYQLPPDQIQAIADYFSANPAMLERLTQRYKELAVWTKDNLGNPMAEQWAVVGDRSAMEMLTTARKTISESADAFSKFVRSKLATTIDVDVVYHARGAGIPGRAGGGPVASGHAYVVGELGPELFIPDAAGSIIPNSGLLGMSPASMGRSGNTYQITIQAGIGDPREIGRQVVEVVKAYERASGPVFASA